MERWERILFPLLRHLSSLSPRCLSISFGLLSSSKYHHSDVFFFSVDLRCFLSADSVYLTGMFEEVISAFQIDSVLTWFIRDTIGAEIKLVALPTDGPAYYYDSTMEWAEAACVPACNVEPSLATQLILPLLSSDLSPEMELLDVFAHLNPGLLTSLTVNSHDYDTGSVPTIQSFRSQTGDRLVCWSEDSEEWKDCLDVVLSVGYQGVPMATSDPIFGVVREKMLLEAKTVFSRPAKSVDKSWYREKLGVPGVNVSVSRFSLILDLVDGIRINETIDWALRNIRGVLMAGVLSEDDFDNFFLEAFSQSAASLVTQIYASGGRSELDAMFPEPMDLQSMQQAIFMATVKQV